MFSGIRKIREHIFYPPHQILASCRECGRELCDGDAAYRLGNAVYCPACVDAALIVCRPHDSAPSHFPRHAAGFAEYRTESARNRTARGTASNAQGAYGANGKDDRN